MLSCNFNSIGSSRLYGAKNISAYPKTGNVAPVSVKGGNLFLDTLVNVSGCSGSPIFKSRAGGVAFRRTGLESKRNNSSDTSVSSSGGSGSATFTSGAGSVTFQPTGTRASPVGEKNLKTRLLALGLAGVAAYGILNTLYYSVTFVLVWLHAAKYVPGQGMVNLAIRMFEIALMVWIGSQATKIPRAFGAIMLAPLVDKGLDFAVEKLNYKSKRQVFMSLLSGCITIALIVLVSIFIMWK